MEAFWLFIGALFVILMVFFAIVNIVWPSTVVELEPPDVCCGWIPGNERDLIAIDTFVPSIAFSTFCAVSRDDD